MLSLNLSVLISFVILCTFRRGFLEPVGFKGCNFGIIEGGSGVEGQADDLKSPVNVESEGEMLVNRRWL